VKPKFRGLGVAAVATVLLLGWQAATVRANYQGNWTALFCVGEKSRHPAELESGTWTFPNSYGYDGQWYRIVAHDPWMRTQMWRSLDTRERYERILFPLVAWLIALGRPAWIDATYILAFLIFVFAGVWITAKWSVIQGHTPLWGLGFALLPGTLISADRMTVDAAEYAFVAAGLYFWRRQNWVACWIAASAAFLTRDLGFVLVAALTGLFLWERAWKRAACFACAAVPAVVWYWHVAHTIATIHRLHLVPRWIFDANLIGPLDAIFHPRNYLLTGWIKTGTQLLDSAAIGGVILAACLAVLALRRPPFTLECVLCALYAGVFLLATTTDFWLDPFSYPRAFSPLVGLIAWRGLTEKRAWFAIPAFCMLARVLWQLGPQALGIAHALFA